MGRLAVRKNHSPEALWKKRKFWRPISEWKDDIKVYGRAKACTRLTWHRTAYGIGPLWTFCVCFSKQISEIAWIINILSHPRVADLFTTRRAPRSGGGEKLILACQFWDVFYCMLYREFPQRSMLSGECILGKETHTATKRDYFSVRKTVMKSKTYKTTRQFAVGVKLGLPL
jgi:hypothetical protein